MDSEFRAFGQVLQSLENGNLLTDLSKELHDLNEAIARQAEEYGKAKGEIALKIKFAADSGGTMTIEAEYNVKRPKSIRSRSVLWLNAKNHLTPANPKQQKLPLVDVSARSGAPVDVGGADQDAREV